MKKTLLLLFLALGLIGYAQTEASYDFNNFTENAPLNGQHGWVARAHSAGGGQLKTEYLGGGGQTTPDETMGVFFDNANTNFGEVATHKSTSEFEFDFSTGGTIEIELDLFRNWWGTCFGVGYDADGDGSVLPPMSYEATCPNPNLPTQDGGIYFITTGQDPRPSFVNGIVLPDNTMPVDFDYDNSYGTWTRWKIMIDLEANNGAGTVSLFADYGCTGEFEPIPEIQGLNAGLTPGSGDRFDPAMWDGVFFLSSSHGGFDNIKVRHTPAGLASQFIEFEAIPNKLVFDAPFDLNATATSGLPVQFEIMEGSEYATLNGNTVSLTGQEGMVKIRASQPGDGTQWQPAPSVNRTFEVVNPNNYTPEITIRRPYDNLNVYMPELKPMTLVLSAYVEHGDVIKFNDVHCEINGQTVQLQTAYPNNPDNGYWFGTWEPTGFGDFSMTASITQSGGKTTTASNHFIVTNNFNDVDAVAMNGDLVVTSANQTVHGEYALPSHVGAFDSINAHYDHQCFNNSCDPYDHIGYVRVKNHRGEWVELFRYCSPFGVACEADVDVTDYTSILQGLVEFEVYYEIWHGWSFNPILTFNMRKGTPDYLYSDIQPIWFGKYEFGDYLNQQPVPECDIEFAEGAEEAHLKLITTGHNWSNSSNNAYNTGNAAEFYEATHHVYVNNALKFDQHLWRECTPNPSGCQPQSGTWTYPRSGWCPGSMGLVWNYDMTAYLPQGGAHLFYQFNPNYIDQCHPNYPDCHDGQNACILCSNPDNPILRVSGMMVNHSNTTSVLVGVKTYPDVEKDPFTLELMPNPAKDRLTIRTDYELGRLSVHIVNAYGVDVRSFAMDKQATIDVSDLPSGVYFVNVIGGKVVTRKIIKN